MNAYISAVGLDAVLRSSSHFLYACTRGSDACKRPASASTVHSPVGASAQVILASTVAIIHSQSTNCSYLCTLHCTGHNNLKELASKLIEFKLFSNWIFVESNLFLIIQGNYYCGASQAVMPRNNLGKSHLGMGQDLSYSYVRIEVRIGAWVKGEVGVKVKVRV